MKKISFFILVCMMVSAYAALAQEEGYRISRDNWQGIEVVFNVESPAIGSTVVDGTEFGTIAIDGYIPSSAEGAPCLPLFSKLIEVPQCDEFDVRVTEAVYDTFMLSGKRLMPAQPSRSKSDTTWHATVIDSKIYATDALFGFDLAEVEAVGIARDRHLARLQFSPVRYNPVSGMVVVCRHAVVSVRYRNADTEASLALFNRYYSPHFASGAAAMNSIYPKSVNTAAPIRYLIVAHSSFRGQLDSFVSWKRRKGFITDIVYTDSAAVGTTTTSIAAFTQAQYTNANAAHPAPTYLLIVGDHEQIPAFTGTTSSSHITDLYYISWTSGDNIPDCYCGRFSAQNGEELIPQIQKTLMYEQYTFADPTFLDRAVLVAGVDGGSAGDYGYTHADPAMDYAATHYINSTNGFTQVQYFKNNTSIIPSASGVTIGSSASSNSATVRGYYNQGAGLINYSAHGSATSWGTPNFTTTHVASMTNSQKFGLMIGNCCLTNKFETTTCFGESLLRKGNYCGAVGYIGGSNSTYWNEDFYWAVGVRSAISATMSMAYNSSNLGIYDRLCHTHGEAYSQWALTQGAVMMVGNLAVESSSTSRKLYYWEIYHLMGDPSVMPYLTQAPAMTVTAPSTIMAGSSTMAVTAAPYAYIALTNAISHTLVAAAYADASGSATLSLPTTLAVGEYELAASAQQYRTAFRQVTAAHPSGTFPIVLQMVPEETPEAGSTTQVDVYVGNPGDSTAYGVTVTLAASDSSAFVFTPATITIDSIEPGDTVTATCTLQVDGSVADGTQEIVMAESSCSVLTQPIVSAHLINVIAPIITVDLSGSSASIQSGSSAAVVAVVRNSGHATFASDRMVLRSQTRMLSVGGGIADTTEQFTLAPGASATLSFAMQASSQLPQGISIPLTLSHLHPLPIPTEEIGIYVGTNPSETFENNTFHTTGWSQGTYPWSITNSGAYGGSYCLRSNSSLTHSQTSQINVSVNLTAADSIVFHYKVSSEANYDKFHFLIDNNDMLTESGEVEWTRAAFPVTAGNHTLSFTYAKDGSVNRNSDCAWIDNLTLPHLSRNASFSSITLCEGEEYDRDTSIVHTLSNGSIEIADYTIFPTYNEEVEHEVCDSLLWNNHTYTASTDSSYMFSSVNGCDSVVTLHLTVHYSVAENISDTVYSENYVWNDSVYVQSGEYTQHLSTQFGCDSVVTLTLTFIDTTTTNIREAGQQTSISVFPNPTRGMLTIDRTVDEATVYDATGRAVLHRRQTKQLDISELPNGVYVMKIVKGGVATVIRVVKR